MKYNPYIVFNGNCEEAVQLYAKALDAEVVIMKYKEAPPNPDFTVSDEMKEKVMHAEVNTKELRFMLCDTVPSNPVTVGDNVHVSLILDNQKQFDKIFKVLKEGAKISMAPGETFFADYYTMFTDKFGIGWQLIIEKKR